MKKKKKLAKKLATKKKAKKKTGKKKKNWLKTGQFLIENAFGIYE